MHIYLEFIFDEHQVVSMWWSLKHAHMTLQSSQRLYVYIMQPT